MKSYFIIFPLTIKFIAYGLGIILEDLARSICSDDHKQKWQLTKKIIHIILIQNESESESALFLVLKFIQILVSHLHKSVLCSHENEVLLKRSSCACQVPSTSCPSPSRCQSSHVASCQAEYRSKNNQDSDEDLSTILVQTQTPPLSPLFPSWTHLAFLASGILH